MNPDCTNETKTTGQIQTENGDAPLQSMGLQSAVNNQSKDWAWDRTLITLIKGRKNKACVGYSQTDLKKSTQKSNKCVKASSQSTCGIDPNIALVFCCSLILELFSVSLVQLVLVDRVAAVLLKPLESQLLHDCRNGRSSRVTCLPLSKAAPFLFSFACLLTCRY